VNVSVPALTVREQRRCLASCLVCATQRLATLRPLSESVNTSLTVAVSESLKLKVVPTGSFCLALVMVASRLLSSHCEADWVTAEIFGAPAAGGGCVWQLGGCRFPRQGTALVALV
jgi:hypothetical protein